MYSTRCLALTNYLLSVAQMIREVQPRSVPFGYPNLSRDGLGYIRELRLYLAYCLANDYGVYPGLDSTPDLDSEIHDNLRDELDHMDKFTRDLEDRDYMRKYVDTRVFRLKPIFAYVLEPVDALRLPLPFVVEMITRIEYGYICPEISCQAYSRREFKAILRAGGMRDVAHKILFDKEVFARQSLGSSGQPPAASKGLESGDRGEAK